MNLLNIIEEIEKVDPEVTKRLSPRRDAIKNITSFGSKVAVAALPFALGTMFKKAYAGDPTTTSAVVDVLNFALSLEYLEADFYTQGLSATNIALTAAIPAADRTTYLNQISADETKHVNFLKTVISGLPGSPPPTPVAKPANGYDFTAGGMFPTAMTNYDTFLLLAETFEDTGVRAYKGQAPALINNQVVLTAALSIHAVEARHASAIRYLRRLRGATIKPWIVGGNDTTEPKVNANYAGEDNVTQGGVNVTTLSSVAGSTTSNATATAAFDEPLTMAQVLALVAPFKP